MMRIIGCGRRQSIPIVHPSAANRVEQLCKEIFRSVSHCFASIPLLNRLVASASVEVVSAHPLSITKNRIQSALAAFKQFAYVHKKKCMRAVAIGTIGFLVYSLRTRDIQLFFNGSESLLSQTWGNVFYNLAMKTVSFLNQSGINLFQMLKYTSSEVAHEVSLISPYTFIQVAHEMISLILVTGFMTAVYQSILFIDKKSELENKMSLAEETQKEASLLQTSNSYIESWKWQCKSLKAMTEDNPSYFMCPWHVEHL